MFFGLIIFQQISFLNKEGFWIYRGFHFAILNVYCLENKFVSLSYSFQKLKFAFVLLFPLLLFPPFLNACSTCSSPFKLLKGLSLCSCSCSPFLKFFKGLTSSSFCWSPFIKLLNSLSLISFCCPPFLRSLKAFKFLKGLRYF